MIVQQFQDAIGKSIRDAGAQARRDGLSIRDCPYTAANMQVWHLEQWKAGYMQEGERLAAGGE